jgi:hypothetical protein
MSKGKAPSFNRIREGFISSSQKRDEIAVGSRCAVTREGDVVCTFMVQSALACNDFCPVLMRSKDFGKTWSHEGPLWPHLQGKQSLFGSVSRSPAGELFFYGSQTRIDSPGESCWSDATQGLKQNQLVRSQSSDGGHTWTQPAVIPMPIPGSAEAPGAMCVTRSGAWLCCYSPYNTFDPAMIVDRNQVMFLRSADRGRSWFHTAMMRFAEPYATAAEAWVIELADGRLLGTCWKLNQKDGSDFPNAYGLSLDGGKTWSPPRSTGILGQSTSLTALPDGRALFTYNQRKHGQVGVWMALVSPTESEFGIVANQVVWSVAQPTQTRTKMGHSNWADFAFGEPSATLLPDGTILVALWCAQPDGHGIRYVTGEWL